MRITEHCNSSQGPFNFRKGMKGYLYEDIGDNLFPYNDGVCGKEVNVIDSYRERVNGDWTEVQTLDCGHWRRIKLDILEHPELRDRSPEWNKLLPFQRDAVIFLEKNGCSGIINDDVGMGKTIIGLSALKENPERFLPCLIVGQCGDVYRWATDEGPKWLVGEAGLDGLHMLPQLIDEKTKITDLAPNMKVYVVSWTRLKGIATLAEELGIRSVIFDESHMYKDERSQRTKAMQRIVEIANTNAKKAGFQTAAKIFLSATPIVNRITEFYTTLNAVDPQSWGSPKQLRYRCDIAPDGRVLGISKHYRPWFFDKTSKYVIRRTKEEVKLPLPDLITPFTNPDHNLWVDVASRQINRATIDEYNSQLDALEKEIEGAHPNASLIIGYMSQLRRLVGLMKVLDIASWAECFFMENPGEKLCIGIHHIDVRRNLAKILAHHNPLEMSDEDAATKDKIEREFKRPDRNLLIASIISAGQGRNLQFCRNCLIGERQWNKEREKQFIGRFHRIITNERGVIRTIFTPNDTVRAWTINGLNTFDQYFDPMVHLKGAICESVDPSLNDDDLLDDFSIMELARAVVMNRMKFVG